MTSGLLRLARTAIAIVGVWMVAAVYFGWHDHTMVVTRGAQDDVRERLLAMAARTMPWAVVTPIVFYLSDLFPLRRRRVRNIAIMAGVVVLVAALNASLGGWLPIMLEGLPMNVADYEASAVAIFHSYVLIAIVLVGLANFLRLEREDAARRRAEVRVEAELAEARLRQLRADLQPHFLFNTLNGIGALLHRDRTAAEETLLRLRDLLRTSMASESVRETSLATELDFIRGYLDIQKMRLGSKLETEIRVAYRRLEYAAVPPLVLQPLVENSIVHGIARRREGGRVIIEVDADGPWLYLRVRDNGGGSGPDTEPRRGSVGVPNARARLESLYGSNQAITYHRSGGELIAEVRIPLRIMESAA